MCGIAGFLSRDPALPVEREALRRMASVLAHRGPDGDGFFFDPKGSLGLAHRRLAIIDTSSEAGQPMPDGSGRYWIIFNGEIYNFHALRAELERGGCLFRTRSDTEVLLALYARDGERMLEPLRGMFAFAIWDCERQTLFLARDRFGVKPLYYSQNGRRFLFASEVKAILEWPGVERRLDTVGLTDYLSFLAVPAPHTLLEGVSKLPAAHYMVVDGSLRVRIERYWDLARTLPPAAILASDHKQHLLALIQESAELRTVSDVPVSVLLSGGTDSTTLVSLLSHDSRRRLRTFCAGVLQSPEGNEYDRARRVAERYHTEHSELVVDLGSVASLMPTLIEHLDDPVADSTAILTYLIFSQIHGAGFKVAIAGEGSDELFAGYPYWIRLLRAAPWFRPARWLPRALCPLIERVTRTRPESRWEILRRAVAGENLFWTGSDGFSEGQKGFFFSHQLRKQVDGYRSSQVIEGIGRNLQETGARLDPLQWMTYSEVNLRLPEMLLGRLDRMSMACSVEGREPFLDHKLFEAAFWIPWQDKIGSFQPKALFKEIIRNVVPAETLSEPKIGFNQPILRWMTPEKTANWQGVVLRFARNSGYFDPRRLERVLSTFHPIYTWYLLVFALWHDRWVEGVGSSSTVMDGGHALDVEPALGVLPQGARQ